MGPRCFYLAVGEHENAVGHANTGKAMGYEDRGLALAPFLEPLEDLEFGPRIQRCRRLIEDQHLGLVHVGAADGNVLPFPAGKLDAVFQEISNQAQARQLYLMTRQHLDLDVLYRGIREELLDMGNFLDVDAMLRQNETVVRLTVVTTFGLISTVGTSFHGMNLLRGPSTQLNCASWRLWSFWR